MSRTTRAVPVLIAGAGPAGLVTAITLARQGIPSLLVERRAGPSTFPRATAISTRSMELFRSWGLEARIRAGEIDAAHVARVAPSLTAAHGVEAPLGFPTRAEALAASPTTPALAPQDHLEPVLLAHLREYRIAGVWFGAELVSMAPGPDGVDAVVRRDGTEVTVRCRFLVGADGAHSTVRRLAGIGMAGEPSLGTHLTALFRAPLDEATAGRRYGLTMLDRPGPMQVMLPAGGGRWLYARALEAGERPTDYPDGRVVDLIRAGAGLPDLDPVLLRVTAFEFAAMVADRYRAGRVFLAGDAAHRITPRGGTGMNTAIHDGFDLGWKLSWVLAGWAHPRLLDTYEAERRPVGLRNTTRSARPGADSSTAFADDLDGRVAHVWQPEGSTLDLLGAGLTLLTGPDGDAWRAAAARLDGTIPCRVRAVDATAADVLGLGTGGAVLLRPDGKRVARWEAPPGEAALARTQTTGYFDLNTSV